jgi:hypothetical protein
MHHAALVSAAAVVRTIGAMPASCSYLRLCALLLLAAAFVAQADASTKKSKYVPPAGFAGHLWGELRTRCCTHATDDVAVIVP